MTPLSNVSFVQCEQVKFRPKIKDRIKVCHSVVAMGAVWGGWKVELIPLLSLFYAFLIRNRYHLL